MLTYGQAACLALDKPSTSNNRKLAKRFFAKSPVAVVYLADGSPLEPIIVAESLTIKNPFKYKSYPQVILDCHLEHTKHPVTKLSKNGEVENQASTVNMNLHTTHTNSSTSNSSSNYPSIINMTTVATRFSKNNVIQYLKATYRPFPQDGNYKDDSLFLTNMDLYQELKTRYPGLENFCSFRRFCLWLHKESDTFGPLKSRRFGRFVKRGRQLWKSKLQTAL